MSIFNKKYTMLLCRLFIPLAGLLAFPDAATSLPIYKDVMPPKPEYYLCPCCGSTHYASVRDMPADEKGCSRLMKIIFNSDVSYNYSFSYTDFAFSNDSIFDWKLKVFDHEKDAYAEITFIDSAGNDTTVTMEYNAVNLSSVPQFLDYGTVSEKNEKVRNFALINNSTKASPVVEKVEFASGRQDYEVLDLELPFTMKVKEEKVFSVKFNKGPEGNYYDTLRMYDSCMTARLTLPLSGTSTGSIDVSDNEKIGSPGFVVSTNPATGQITLALAGQFVENVKISLFTIAGMELPIYQGPATDYSEFDLNVPGLNKGVYLLKVQAGNTVYTEKIALY